jgi:hypothetical protein
MAKKRKSQIGSRGAIRDTNAILEGLALQERMMDEHKWVWHYVVDDLSDTVNAHTHGLVKNFGHVDLQITLPLSMLKVRGVFNSVVDHIKEGRRFVDGEVADRILCEPYKVKFVRAEESGREVLRIIVPDARGSLDPETMDRAYARQFDELNTNQS